jgi:trehalose-6-phosphate synthase
VRVGFFLHSPFPSSEIFRAFPMREELLRGLLNADLVGFHTFDYARHFLSCCSRMLGLDFQSKRGSIALEYFGRSGALPSPFLSFQPVKIAPMSVKSSFCSQSSGLTRKKPK